MPTDQIYAHLPWLHRHELLPRILDLGLAPEIAFKGPELDELLIDQLTTVAGVLVASGCRPTVHAPFFDLNPGAMEPMVREITLRRLTQSLQAAARLGAHLMVVHPGYDRWRYPNLAATWIEQAAATFTPLVVLAEQYDCRLAVENIYEENAATLTALVDHLRSPWFGHCFDIGHWQLFGREVQGQWLAQIAPRLLHLHLHDNHGQSDDHLPIGDGIIDFLPLRRVLSTLPTPPSITLEAHNLAELQRSLANFQTLFPKEPNP